MADLGSQEPSSRSIPLGESDSIVLPNAPSGRVSFNDSGNSVTQTSDNASYRRSRRNGFDVPDVPKNSSERSIQGGAMLDYSLAFGNESIKQQDNQGDSWRGMNAHKRNTSKRPASIRTSKREISGFFDVELNETKLKKMASIIQDPNGKEITTDCTVELGTTGRLARVEAIYHDAKGDVRLDIEMLNDRGRPSGEVINVKAKQVRVQSDSTPTTSVAARRGSVASDGRRFSVSELIKDSADGNIKKMLHELFSGLSGVSDSNKIKELYVDYLRVQVRMRADMVERLTKNLKNISGT